MSNLRELKARARSVAGPIVITLIAGYFTYHVVQGEHGLISYHKLRTQVSEAEQISRNLSAQRQALYERTARLRADHLDADLLDQTARQKLLLTRPDEIVILLD